MYELGTLLRFSILSVFPENSFSRIVNPGGDSNRFEASEGAVWTGALPLIYYLSIVSGFWDTAHTPFRPHSGSLCIWQFKLLLTPLQILWNMDPMSYFSIWNWHCCFGCFWVTHSLYVTPLCDLSTVNTPLFSCFWGSLRHSYFYHSNESKYFSTKAFLLLTQQVLTICVVDSGHHGQRNKRAFTVPTVG